MPYGHRPPLATVKALEDSTVFAVPRSALADRLREDDALAARFYRALALLLSSRMRGTIRRLGYGQTTGEDADVEDELDPGVLDTVSRAGQRSQHLLQRLMSG